ncbi:MAG: molybdopterin cofactor-binding domain-containing protein, partial [Candidatus Eremiobacterota bacterium]
HSTGIKECLETIKNHSLWKEKEEWKKKASIFKKRGTGLAAIFNAAGYGKNVRDSAIAKVELTEKGKIRVYNGVSDMGQGNSPTFLQIAGEILSQNTEDMELIQPDTSISHPSGSSTAGRTTYTYGKALIKACEDLKEILINRAGLFLFTDNDSNLRLMPGKVVNKQDGREISLEKLGTYMKDFERICVNHYVAPVCKNIPPSSEGLLFGFPHIIFSYGAHLVYIEIDELTGQIEIKKYLAVTDGGQVINPALYDQQVHGAVTQGLGYAIMEDFIIKNGHILTDNLATYIIPGSMDIPDIISIPVKTDEESGPFGMKGIGEVGINGPLPAVANAIYDACGIYIKEAPFTGEKMLEKRKTL